MAEHDDFEFGLDPAAQITVDETGLLPDDEVIRDAIGTAVLADSVAIISFNIGEHDGPEFMHSARHVLLAALAGRTEPSGSSTSGNRSSPPSNS